MNTDQSTNNNRGSIQQPGQESSLDKAFWLVLGSIISSVFGIAFFMWQRSRSAKDHFAVTVSLLAGELERSSNCLAFYSGSMDRLEDAVFRLRPFLRKRRANDLSTAWNQYRRAQRALESASDGGPIEHYFYESFPELAHEKVATKRQLLEWFLRRFADVAA